MNTTLALKWFWLKHSCAACKEFKNNASYLAKAHWKQYSGFHMYGWHIEPNLKRYDLNER